MKKKLAKLVDVKSIITILMAVVFCVLSLTGKISAQQFLTIFATFIAFYFGTQQKKNTSSDESEGEA